MFGASSRWETSLWTASVPTRLGGRANGLTVSRRLGQSPSVRACSFDRELTELVDKFAQPAGVVEPKLAVVGLLAANEVFPG